MTGGVESVLLYYKYVDLTDSQEEHAVWFKALCTRLHLVGRVRVARDGINVTVGGRHADLLEHIEAVSERPEFGNKIDFKLAKSIGPLNGAATQETKFDRLQVTTCKEVVSLGLGRLCLPELLLERSGKHLSPTEWHALLGSMQHSNERPAVLLDARNAYETSIGCFSAAGCELLDPKTRSFGEFPAWAQANADKLAGRRVMMYCTGGVRCEMASAFIKSLGPAHQDVFQLSGGIQRYLEQFPEGGFFNGKNFVFDERVAVPPEEAPQNNVIGRCLLCHILCDDYSPRSRCNSCRMLVLVCKACLQQAAGQQLCCELCKQRTRAQAAVHSSTKLRILCLHGFRSSAASMRIQNSSFFNGLKDLAEFVFVDAPHRLPFFYRPALTAQGRPKPLPEIDPSRPRRAWLIDPASATCTTQASNQAEEWQIAPEELNDRQFMRQTGGWAESRDMLLDVLHKAGPFHGILGISQASSCTLQDRPQLAEIMAVQTPGAAVAAELCAVLQSRQRMKVECNARLQSASTQSLQAQTDNYLPNLRSPAAEQPSPDCLASQDRGQSQASINAERMGCASSGDELHLGMPSGSLPNQPVQFILLGSGYALKTEHHDRLSVTEQCINVPSLHVFRAEGDRQISHIESEALCNWFSTSGRQTVKHSKGHTLPADKSNLAQCRAFLQQFLNE